MGFGSATKKISKVADMAEEVYKRLNELREQVQELRKTVQATHDRVERLETTVEQQTAVIEALAEQEGIDVERIHAEAAIEEAEGDPSAPETEEASASTDGEPAPETD
ncbi:MAG: DUF5798 family protein [Haloarculaceae archaeon]